MRKMVMTLDATRGQRWGRRGPLEPQESRTRNRDTAANVLQRDTPSLWQAESYVTHIALDHPPRHAGDSLVWTRLLTDAGIEPGR